MRTMFCWICGGVLGVSDVAHKNRRLALPDLDRHVVDIGRVVDHQLV